MRPSPRKLEITILSLTMPRPVLLSRAHRPKEVIFCFISMIDPLFSFLPSVVGSRRYFSLDISIFCVYDGTGILQRSGMFLLFSYKTKAWARQDLYNSKQYCFYLCAPLQSTQNENTSEGLQEPELCQSMLGLSWSSLNKFELSDGN